MNCHSECEKYKLAQAEHLAQKKASFEQCAKTDGRYRTMKKSWRKDRSMKW